MNKLALSFLLSLCFCVSVSAMDFRTEFSHKFQNFLTIKPEILKKALDSVPEQTESWSCGKHQCGHVQTCAYYGSNEVPTDLCMNEPGKYPLAVDISAQFLNNFNKIIPIKFPTDKEGNFRVGATPHEMAYYINDRILPKSYAYQAEAISNDELKVEDLAKLVRTNIDKNLPVLAFYVVDPNAKRMHIYSIVGIANNNQEVLMLDSHGKGFGRLKTMEISSLVANMNATPIVTFVTNIDNLGSLINLRKMITDSGGRVVCVPRLKAWKAYSLVTFVPKDELGPRIVEDHTVQVGCAQQ